MRNVVLMGINYSRRFSGQSVNDKLDFGFLYVLTGIRIGIIGIHTYLSYLVIRLLCRPPVKILYNHKSC